MLKIGDAVNVSSGDGTFERAVYWYTAYGTGMRVVLKLDTKGWHPEFCLPHRVIPVVPTCSCLDDMPEWARRRQNG